MNKDQYGPDGMLHFAKKVEFLDNPNKRGDIPPEQLLRMLPINKDDHILDVGAGTGYITIPAAKIVHDGLVYALDIDAKMLDLISSKVAKEKIPNVKTLKGRIEDMPINDNSIDMVLASIVLHELKDLSTALNQIKRVLKSEGFFVCVEFEKKEGNVNHPRISSSVMEQEITSAGFRETKKLHPTDDLYIIIAKNE
ncbi:class I SAM-dependent methyltransferase [Gracilibacillus sp. HCP3S3_G5_1]|uniref:class I SAM-dependent methyltransferase n=1 Tax=unclassified Gracilibacillus TaxID=2625209 RepID=UPI003F8BAC4B